jgi:GTP-binding protein HflX
MYETKEAPAKALLFSLKEDGSDPLMEALNREELESLVSTLGDEVLSSEEIPVRTISPATYIGSGKVQEIKEEIQENDANLVVFNMILSPRVQRNLEKAWETPVIDREEVILRIFAQRPGRRKPSSRWNWPAAVSAATPQTDVDRAEPAARWILRDQGRRRDPAGT